MRAHTLAGITLTIAIFAGGQAAYAQAAAESVLLNSNSAAATVKAGTAMGNALNGASNKLANQLPATVAHPRPAHAASGVEVKIERTPRMPVSSASAATPAKPANPNGSLITSIQGGKVSKPALSSAQPAQK